MTVPACAELDVRNKMQTTLFVFFSLKATHFKVGKWFTLFCQTALRGTLSHVLCTPVGQSCCGKTDALLLQLASLSLPHLLPPLVLQREKGVGSLTSPVALDGGITGLTTLNLTPLLITCRISRLAPRGVLS